MDRFAPHAAPPAAEPRVLLPLDIEEDPADESIYGMGYRARVGVVVSERTAPQPPAENPTTSAGGTAPRR